jgi:transposase
VRLEALRTAEGHELPPRLKAEIVRQIERLKLILHQIAEVEAARDAMLAAERQATPSPDETDATPVMLPTGEGAGARLMRLKGVGPETASVLCLEAFHRSFATAARWLPMPA